MSTADDFTAAANAEAERSAHDYNSGANEEDGREREAFRDGFRMALDWARDALEYAEAERDRLRERQESHDLANEAIRWKRRAHQAEARVRAIRRLHVCGSLSEVWGPSTWYADPAAPVCQYCTRPDGMDPVRWPCDTIRALDA